jgi:hypothetical protein
MKLAEIEEKADNRVNEEAQSWNRLDSIKAIWNMSRISDVCPTDSLFFRAKTEVSREMTSVRQNINQCQINGR